MTRRSPIPADFYDKAYFTDGSKSNYAPYGPGGWATGLSDMVWEHLRPRSVLDVGCAYGYVVERLSRRGIPASGFDISEYAISQATADVWVGDASSLMPWITTDLVLATELPEHLTPTQARRFLRYAHRYGERALLLIAMHADGQAVDMQHEKDLSHINIKPVSWWEAEVVRAGWTIGDAGPFNTDPRSINMQWDGRWLYLVKE